MLCLAQSWVDLDSIDRIVCLYGGKNYRYASLGSALGRWDAGGEVLAEEMTPEEIAVMEAAV